MDLTIDVLKGKTLLRVLGLEEGSEEVIFICNDGSVYKMFHCQDCCEHVTLADFNLVGSLEENPILATEESRSSEEPPLENEESYTWTFYTICTIKGSLWLRWLGTSNGCYSESVDIQELVPPNPKIKSIKENCWAGVDITYQ